MQNISAKIVRRKYIQQQLFTKYFNYKSSSFLVKDLFKDNQNKDDIFVKYLNESLID